MPASDSGRLQMRPTASPLRVLYPATIYREPRQIVRRPTDFRFGQNHIVFHQEPAGLPLRCTGAVMPASIPYQEQSPPLLPESFQQLHRLYLYQYELDLQHDCTEVDGFPVIKVGMPDASIRF